MSTNKWAKVLAFVVGVGFLGGLNSCKDDEPTLTDPPSMADAQFTYTTSPSSDNVLMLTASNSNMTNQWDFGNGLTGEGYEVTAEYPFAGEYTITLTVYNAGGSNSSSQVITIDQDDPGLLDNPLFDLLTGGSAGPGYKTWAVDSASDGHFGVGPNPSQNGDWPEYYQESANGKVGSGMYTDRYTFKLSGYEFDMVTNGVIYLNDAHSADWPNAYDPGVGDLSSAFPDQLGENWSITEGADTTLTVTGSSFIGWYCGAQTYKIVNIEENQLILRAEDSQETDLAWYFRLVPEGYNSDTAAPPPAPTATLPMDFETVEPNWGAFGNSTVQFIDNPDQSGINTSMRVMETVHGNETWAGLEVSLASALDFSSQTSITIKVWAPATGAFRLKLEEIDDANSFVEVDVNVTTANAWEEITFDLTGTPNIYNKLVIFPGWDVSNAGTFYIDDIVQQ